MLSFTEIDRRRDENGIAQKQLCEQAGVTAAAYSKWRNGREGITEKSLARLNDALNALMPAHKSNAVNSAQKRILLIIGGGIAAYKCLDLIRRLRERGYRVRAIMTKAAQEFITPLSVGVLTADKVFDELFSREDEQDVGHIRLARECDIIVVAPATADLMAKMANGLANDLASTVLLATNKPVLVAPAMNPVMWSHAATRRNFATLGKDGVHFVGPNKGEKRKAARLATDEWPNHWRSSPKWRACSTTSPNL